MVKDFGAPDRASTAVGHVFSGCPGPDVGPSARRGRGISGGVGEDARESKVTHRSHSSSLFNQFYLCGCSGVLGLVTLVPSPWQLLRVAGAPGLEVKTVPELSSGVELSFLVESRLRDLAHWQGIWIYYDLRAEGFSDESTRETGDGHADKH